MSIPSPTELPDDLTFDDDRRVTDLYRRMAVQGTRAILEDTPPDEVKLDTVMAAAPKTYGLLI